MLSFFFLLQQQMGILKLSYILDLKSYLTDNLKMELEP